MTNSDSDVETFLRDTAQELALETLRQRGGARTRAVAKLAAFDRELEDAIVAADAAGVPRLTIAKESGVVRATVYAILERKGAHTREPVQP